MRVGRPLLVLSYASPRLARAIPALAPSPELGRRGPPNPVEGKEDCVAVGGNKSRAVKRPPGMPSNSTSGCALTCTEGEGGTLGDCRDVDGVLPWDDLERFEPPDLVAVDAESTSDFRRLDFGALRTDVI